MTRPRGFMTKETLLRCAIVLKALGQSSVGVLHYGESLLHPQFNEFVNVLVDLGITPWINTNGFLITKGHYSALRKMSQVIVSAHMPAQERQELCSKLRENGINSYWQSDMTPDNAITIANQVIGYSAQELPPLTDPATQCKFITNDVAIVLWNGDLVPCCCCGDSTVDNGEVFGNIHDVGCEAYSTPVVPLCAQCGGHPGGVNT